MKNHNNKNLITSLLNDWIDMEAETDAENVEGAEVNVMSELERGNE